MQDNGKIPPKCSKHVQYYQLIYALGAMPMAFWGA
jgi:hypothetical protein